MHALPPRPALLSLSLMLAYGSLAQAQTAPIQHMDTVRVTGQAASLRGALDKQRQAVGVLNVVHADDIGQLPDNNAAEALARLPGVSVERDQGEGRFIRIRGLGPDYNAVNINGAQTPASESGLRAPGLDLVPSGLIRALEVDKTLRPEMDANALGGTVTVRTLSAFDVPGRLLTADIGLNHDANAGRSRPRAGLSYAERWLDGRLGVALALSLDQRRFASDNTETGGDWAGDKLKSFEMRRYEISRKRQGLALNLDYKPGEGRRLYLRSFSSRFEDQEQRQSAKFSFSTAIAPGGLSDGSVSRGLKARLEDNRSASLVAGAELQQDAWRAWAELGQGKASEAKPGALASSAFKGSFKGLSYTDTEQPLPLTQAAFRNPANFSFDKAKLQDGEAHDRIRHARLDLQRELEAAGWDLALKVGLKSTRRNKDSALQTYAPSGKKLAAAPYQYGKDRLAMGGYLLEEAPEYAWGDFGPGLDETRLAGLWSGLALNDFLDPVDSITNDWVQRERVQAGYVQLQAEHQGTQWIAGLRHERHRFMAEGFASEHGNSRPLSLDSGSRHWLPALLVRQQLSPDSVLRAALTHAVVRPSFSQTSPGVVTDGDTATLGNPALKPLRSRNLDLGLDHQLGRDGQLSAWIFHKRIRDFAFQTNLAGTPAWAGYTSVSSHANGGDAQVSGVELGYTQALRGLPGAWGGLILAANASLTHSRAEIGAYEKGRWRSRHIRLPSQSDRAVNLSLGWEGQGLSARIALNHKSPYLLEVGDVLDAGRDRLVAAQNQIDFSLRYQIDRRWQLSLEALNLGNERYYVYQERRWRNVQLEQYGRSLKLGLKLAVY